MDQGFPLEFQSSSKLLLHSEAVSISAVSRFNRVQSNLERSLQNVSSLHEDEIYLIRILTYLYYWVKTWSYPSYLKIIFVFGYSHILTGGTRQDFWKPGVRASRNIDGSFTVRNSQSFVIAISLYYFLSSTIYLYRLPILIVFIFKA